MPSSCSRQQFVILQCTLIERDATDECTSSVSLWVWFTEAYAKHQISGWPHPPHPWKGGRMRNWRSMFALLFSSIHALTAIEDKVILCIPPTQDPPASASGMLALHWNASITLVWHHAWQWPLFNIPHVLALTLRKDSVVGRERVGQLKLRELHAC